MTRPRVLVALLVAALAAPAAAPDGAVGVSLETTPAATDTTPPQISDVRARRTVREGRPWTMRLTVSEPATLGVNWWRGLDVVAFKKIVTPAGEVVVHLGGRRLDPGRHRVSIAARDHAGNLAVVDVLWLRVLPRR